MPTTQQGVESTDLEDVALERAPISEDKRTGKFSPFAGCLIMIIVGLLVLGIISFTWWSYKQVQATVEGFAESDPVEVTLVDVTGEDSAQLSLGQKLKGFRRIVGDKQVGELSLTADELNLAIASYEILEPNRRQLSITSISEEGLVADISYPLNARLFSDEKLYLNGEVTIMPEVTGGFLFPTVKKVRTSQHEDIPQEFKKFISETMLRPMRDDAELGQLLQRISSVKIVGNAMILKTEPDFVAAGELPDDKAPIINRFMKGFGIVAVVFLFIVSIIIFISRRKAPKTI